MDFKEQSAPYPDNFTIGLPEPYLTAIGRVCVQWSLLETIVSHAICTLSGFKLYDPRPAMLTTHMSWPLRMDVLASLVEAHQSDFPHFERFREVAPMLKKAQSGRNKIIHSMWTYDDGIARILRATSRGKLKTSITPMEVSEIDAIVDDIGAAAAKLLKLVLNK